MKINYTIRYYFQLITGAITFFAVILFGAKGMAALSIIALEPFIMWINKIKPDERELALLHDTNSVTIIIVVPLAFILYFLSASLSNSFIQLHWWRIAICLFLLLHGGVGLYHLKYK